MMTLMNRFWRDSRASLAAYMALTIPVLIGSVGMAIDVGESYLVRGRLQGALDAAALATAAATSSGDENIEEILTEYFEINYPPEKIGTTFDLDFDDTDEQLSVTASARYDTMFMHILGIDEINVNASTTVVRAVRGIEAVLVLDNTGSMAGSNITALKNASKTFINTLYDRAGDDEEYVKIGIVPYSASVNVGRYGLGKNPDGSDYGDVFVDLPGGVSYNSSCTGSSKTRWCGCVMAEAYPGDTEEFDTNVAAYMYKNCTSSNLSSCSIQNYPNQVDPSGYCPKPVTPLTSDRADLIAAVDAMSTGGYTLGNFGMIWGYRVISPEAPFEEGAAWDDYIWRKAIVMMTDGDNNIAGSDSGVFTAYGHNRTISLYDDDMDDRFTEICEMLETQGILVYTIVFTSGISQSTKDMYRDCATTSNMYYYAPSNAELEDAFEKIARELSNLHLSN